MTDNSYILPPEEIGLMHFFSISTWIFRFLSFKSPNNSDDGYLELDTSGEYLLVGTLFQSRK